MGVRTVVAIALVAGAVLAVATARGAALAAPGAAGLAARLVLFPRRTACVSVVPILAFAALLAVIQQLSAGRVSLVPARTIVVFLLLSSATRLAAPALELTGVRPQSALWRLVLFALITRHFAAILRVETARAVRAWSLCAPRRFDPMAWRSLSWALVTIVLRCWRRAECFYAAQRLRGLGT